MALNVLGVEVPAATDMFDPDGDMRELGDSLEGRLIIPVANTTDRNALATALSPSTSQPLFVYRADAPVTERIEWTVDGATWRVINTAGKSEAFAPDVSFPAAVSATTTPLPILRYTIPAASYDRRFNLNGTSYVAYSQTAIYEMAWYQGSTKIGSARKSATASVSDSVHADASFFLAALATVVIELRLVRVTGTGAVTNTITDALTSGTVVACPA